MKKLGVILGVIILLIGAYYLFMWWGSGLAGGGGSEHIVPDTAKTGEPIKIELIVSTWGSGGPIKGRYQDITLAYNLTNFDSNFVQGKLVELPQNYKNASTETKQWEAYEFIIPAYSKGTTGEITYSIDMKFDGNSIHQEGIKKIKLTDN